MVSVSSWQMLSPHSHGQPGQAPLPRKVWLARDRTCGNSWETDHNQGGARWYPWRLGSRGPPVNGEVRLPCLDVDAQASLQPVLGWGPFGRRSADHSSAHWWRRAPKKPFVRHHQEVGGRMGLMSSASILGQCLVLTLHSTGGESCEMLCLHQGLTLELAVKTFIPGSLYSSRKGKRGSIAFLQALTLLLLELILTHEHGSQEFSHRGLDGHIELACMCADERQIGQPKSVVGNSQQGHGSALARFHITQKNGVTQLGSQS